MTGSARPDPEPPERGGRDRGPGAASRPRTGPNRRSGIPCTGVEDPAAIAPSLPTNRKHRRQAVLRPLRDLDENERSLT
ncbi:protein of unassigned function [Methylobacterium oryzae CBMB20]|uniref:Protein of unassigned function n=1 Tax=Methylobacterium oryzae CBMB20 TaxID=693986 RepID=A0A089NRD1_9HYPH|nr:protein of unassigned function [Methylobacterium oryzae CBMB20]